MSRAIYFVLFWLVSWVHAQLPLPPPSPIVTLPQGALQGIQLESRNGTRYYSFRGIPYAQPPRRFEEPEPATIPGWTGVRNASEIGSYCIQAWNNYGSEDCLFLNVDTNVDLSNPSHRKLPVIVFLHGGGFMSLSGALFGGSAYLMDEPHLFVSINYRLSAMGFLSLATYDEDEGIRTTQDEDDEPKRVDIALGNMGLKDMVLALHWVQQNIEHFGGDKDQVTLLGQSAGAIAASLLMLSPIATGLFHSVISMSGTALNSAALVKDASARAKDLAQRLNCPTNSASAVLECFLALPARDIIRFGDDTPFRPTLELPGSPNAFMTEEPATLLAEGRYTRVPMIIGLCRNESSAQSKSIVNNPENLADLNANWYTRAPSLLNYAGIFKEQYWNFVSAELYDFYFGLGNNLTVASEFHLESMLNDRQQFHGAHVTAVAQAQHQNSIYLLFLDHSLREDGAVLHGDDLPYYTSGEIGTPSGTALASEFEEVSIKFVKVIASFVRDGKPDASAVGTDEWPAVSAQEGNIENPLKWYHIDLQTSLQNESFVERMLFWDRLIDAYGAD